MTPFLENLAAILAARVTVFSTAAACGPCCLEDFSSGKARTVRLIQKKPLVSCSCTN